MSSSLLKKSLKLFEEKSERVSKKRGQKQSHKANKTAWSTETLKQQPTLKDKKIKSALDAYSKKNPKEDRTEGNLAILLNLSQKKKLEQASTEKILSYHLKKHRKVVEAEPEKKQEGTVFTEEDFLKFEQEYFVKCSPGFGNPPGHIPSIICPLFDQFWVMNSFIKLGKATVVGISGVTCGGKTSLTKMLKKTYPQAMVISQDDYFLPNNSNMLPESLGGINHANWDCIESLDMVKMMEKIHLTLADMESQSKTLLLVEGFLIFNYPPLARLCDLKYFLTLPYDECWARRQTRDYDPPDPPEYFQRCVWPMYQRNLQDMQNAPYSNNITFLDGTAPLDDNYRHILRDIDGALNNHSELNFTNP